MIVEHAPERNPRHRQDNRPHVGNVDNFIVPPPPQRRAQNRASEQHTRQKFAGRAHIDAGHVRHPPNDPDDANSNGDNHDTDKRMIFVPLIHEIPPKTVLTEDAVPSLGFGDTARYLRPNMVSTTDRRNDSVPANPSTVVDALVHVSAASSSV
ncbi:protein of unknown function (plasmid) [Pararobbsia alpina]